MAAANQKWLSFAQTVQKIGDKFANVDAEKVCEKHTLFQTKMG